MLERKQQLKQLQQQQLDALREEHAKKMKTTEGEYSNQVGTGCGLRGFAKLKTFQKCKI